ncbi:hypothetical protein FRB96_000966 [Tulasnella sp. 330]|nr:hypothetical protein FRB96_000966 [Tulasnella sp. 330]KAG8881903.1 hypothetical protein FRB97_008950 [Tulasnella sp. 331]KAG8887868.1 hypothetical protein FRB98_008834 [Tulasnella sp. 332]
MASALDGLDISALLPPSLLLSPRLSAHKYLMVCTLTVAAWDTLVLSPRTWKLMKTSEWPFLKIAYHILRYLMPIEFTITAVAFFDTDFSLARCNKFYLFEPICTVVLMCVASASLAVRLYAVYDRSKLVMGLLGGFLFLQIVAMGVCTAFYKVVPLATGQGCIAGPQFNWVGVYWLAPTLFYAFCLALAVTRSAQVQKVKPTNLWKLFLRDGLNLYGAIFLVNLINVVFWFVITPTGPEDAIKTICTSITAVLTTTMTLRVILNVKGSLVSGGSYGGSFNTSQSGNGPNGTYSQQARNPPTNVPHQLSSRQVQSTTNAQNIGYSNDHPGQVGGKKEQANWANGEEEEEEEVDVKAGYMVDDLSARDHYGEKPQRLDDDGAFLRAKTTGGIGVKVSVDRDIK